MDHSALYDIKFQKCMISTSITNIRGGCPLKADIHHNAGGLQMCTGIRSGIEAAVHMNEKAWNEEETEAVLLVDANNAFNRLNRKVALHYIKEICPPIYTFLYNHYQTHCD